jgi:hypothetical protein
MKKRVTIILTLAVLFLMCNCSDKAMVKYPFSPKQAKKIFSAKSSASLTPDLLKDDNGSQYVQPSSRSQFKKKKI